MTPPGEGPPPKPRNMFRMKTVSEGRKRQLREAHAGLPPIRLNDYQK